MGKGPAHYDISNHVSMFFKVELSKRLQEQSNTSVAGVLNPESAVKPKINKKDESCELL